jgi:hypothetical protein
MKGTSLTIAQATARFTPDQAFEYQALDYQASRISLLVAKLYQCTVQPLHVQSAWTGAQRRRLHLRPSQQQLGQQEGPAGER